MTDHKPMAPERLADIREGVEWRRDRPMPMDDGRDVIIAELLAHADTQEQQAEREIGDAYERGRRHERLDVVDFVTGPPGRIPDGARQCVVELAVALRAGTHEGWAKRLYDRDDAADVQLESVP
jgi:hypothetical protein